MAQQNGKTIAVADLREKINLLKFEAPKAERMRKNASVASRLVHFESGREITEQGLSNAVTSGKLSTSYFMSLLRLCGINTPMPKLPRASDEEGRYWIQLVQEPVEAFIPRVTLQGGMTFQPPGIRWREFFRVHEDAAHENGRKFVRIHPLQALEAAPRWGARRLWPDGEPAPQSSRILYNQTIRAGAKVRIHLQVPDSLPANDRPLHVLAWQERLSMDELQLLPLVPFPARGQSVTMPSGQMQGRRVLQIPEGPDEGAYLNVPESWGAARRIVALFSMDPVDQLVVQEWRDNPTVQPAALDLLAARMQRTATSRFAMCAYAYQVVEPTR